MTRKVVTPERGWVEIPLRLLEKAPWNYKTDDPVLAQKLAANIRKNGFILNIVVREIDGGRYEVIDGNHRLDALRLVGIKNVRAYNLGPIPEIRAKRVAIELNETRFDNDQYRLFETMQELLEGFEIEDLAATLPITEVELEKYQEIINSGNDMVYEFGDPDDPQQPDPNEPPTDPTTEDDGEAKTPFDAYLNEHQVEQVLQVCARYGVPPDVGPFIAFVLKKCGKELLG